MRILRIVLLILFDLACETFVCSGQSCTGSSCSATTCNYSDVLAALPSNSNTNATVTVTVPGGTCSWTSNLSYTVPSAVTNLTISGATTVSCSGTHGTSSYLCTATDTTVIQDSAANNTPLMAFTLNGTGKIRISQLTIQGGSAGSGNQKYNGLMTWNGSSQNFRMDHVHFNNTTYSPALSTSWLRTNGSTNGVIDHSVFDMGDQTSVANVLQVYSAYGDSVGMGDGTYANATPWGTVNGVYIEDNYFTGGAPNDCANAGFFVMRYNTINKAYVGVQTHGTKTPGGAQRGCRGYEAYHNYFTGPGGAAETSASVGSKIGTALVWGNTMASGTSFRFWQGGGDRQSGDETETNTPNGWGYCGTAVNGNGVGSPWDGNSPSTSTGYPCLDGIGRGQTVQALNGANFPGRLNNVTGTIAWPQQYLEPVYMWNNSIGSATYVLWNDGSVSNQDYYYDAGSSNPSCSSSFNGSCGTGFGVLLSRPSTCTAGPGGTYFTSPTGSYGVAYFATDANSGNGGLFVCTKSSPVTWTQIYQPFTYPHPLVSGVAPPPPPMLLISGNNTSIVSNWSINGNSCATGVTTNCISSYTETLTPPQSQPVTIITVSGSALTYTYAPGGNLLCGTWGVSLVANWLDYSGSPAASPPATGSVLEPCPAFVPKPPTGLTLAVV